MQRDLSPIASFINMPHEGARAKFDWRKFAEDNKLYEVTSVTFTTENK